MKRRGFIAGLLGLPFAAKVVEEVVSEPGPESPRHYRTQWDGKTLGIRCPNQGWEKGELVALDDGRFGVWNGHMIVTHGRVEAAVGPGTKRTLVDFDGHPGIEIQRVHA